MKRVFVILTISIICFSSCQKPAPHLEWVNFNWEGDSINGRYFERLAIMVPLKIEDLPYTFKAQFDLGARTSIYENCFKPYLKKHPYLIKKLGTKFDRSYHRVKCNSFNDLNIYLDGVPYKNRSIINFVNYGDSIPKDSIFTATPKKIGTIGVDLFSDKIMIIDYPNKRFCSTLELPSTYKVSYFDFKFENNFIKIPVMLNKVQEYLIFDTGSSNWELITSEDDWRKIADTNSTAVDSLEGRSWGVKHYIWWSKCKYDLLLGGRKFKNINAYYSQNLIGKFLKRENVLGITGNRLFWNDIIVIDFIHKKFGIVSKKNLCQLI